MAWGILRSGPYDLESCNLRNGVCYVNREGLSI